ncbi:sensor histidine kinase [Polaribacter sp. Hel1_85]|uniref:sensor histidine kinase n=1 Tax=Polaribacter sp. Hel1_85 TaxID=1250005 RepID=UPI00052B575A|nr:sensor histidine kinase [Polaribacter sp. Hel1_85]KGL62158.1 two component system sensory transduction histidine kinase [Polaribacter sp. Hel1_85]
MKTLNHNKNITFLLSLLFACQYFCAQDLDSIYKKLEIDLLRFHSPIVIKEVDSILHKNEVSGFIINDLKALKVEALAEYSFFVEALNLSNEVLSIKDSLSERAEVRIRIQRALIFEYFEKTKEAFSELDRLEEIYTTRIKYRYYGQYLFRKSSSYRVLKPVEKSDSIALFYANKAAAFGDLYKYYDVSAIAKMLQSFFVDKNDYINRTRLLKASLKDFKLLENPLSVSMMYTSLARIYQKNKQLAKARKYLDSALTEAKVTKDLYLMSSVFKQRSIFLESINQQDSALYYFKKYHNAETEINYEKQNLEVAEINFKNELKYHKLEVLKSKSELLESKKNNYYLIVFSIGSLFLIGLIFVLYRRLSKKNKEVFSRNEKLNQSINEKKVLLKELNHRVKNNLSLIISLIKFQSKEFDNDIYKESFVHLENRINTIVIAHEQFIYSENEIEGKFYNLQEYLQKISEPLINLSTRKIDFKQKVKNIRINLDTALPIGILMNELISNSLEHGVTNDVLVIRVSIKSDGNNIFINYFDSGSTFKVKENNNSLGLFIIDSMIAQLNGTYTRKGSAYEIVLKHKN